MRFTCTWDKQRYAHCNGTAYGCHLTDMAKDPTAKLASFGANHPDLRLSTTCESCHTTTSWRGRGLTTTPSRFRLTGAQRQCGLQPVPHPFHSAATRIDIYFATPINGMSTVTLALDRSSEPTAKSPTAGLSDTCASCPPTVHGHVAVFNHSAPRFRTGFTPRWPATSCHLTSASQPLDCYSLPFVAGQSTRYGGTVQDHSAPKTAVAGISQTRAGQPQHEQAGLSGGGSLPFWV